MSSSWTATPVADRMVQHQIEAEADRADAERTIQQGDIVTHVATSNMPDTYEVLATAERTDQSWLWLRQINDVREHTPFTAKADWYVIDDSIPEGHEHE